LTGVGFQLPDEESKVSTEEAPEVTEVTEVTEDQ
jgi:hypothetical protein